MNILRTIITYVLSYWRPAGLPKPLPVPEHWNRVTAAWRKPDEAPIRRPDNWNKTY